MKNGMTTIILRWLGIGLALAFLAGCASPSEEALEAVRSYYRENRIVGFERGDWYAEDIRDESGDVHLTVAMPPRDASEIMRYPLERPRYVQQRLIGKNACPPKSAPLWNLLEPGQDILVSARASGTTEMFFLKLSCREFAG